MAILTCGNVLFVFEFLGMWLYAALDAWRIAHAIRSGLTPDVAEDILVRRFAGNPKLWGIVLTVLGVAFMLQNVFNLRGLMRGFVPAMLIGLGIYVLRGDILQPKEEDGRWADFDSARPARFFSGIVRETRYRGDEEVQTEYSSGSRAGGWGNR